MLNVAEIFAEPITMPTVVKPTAPAAHTREAATSVESEVVDGASASNATLDVATERCEAVRNDGPQPLGAVNEWEHDDRDEAADLGPLQLIDASELIPCSSCGSLESWQTYLGNWRCLRCDPPTASRRLAERAAAIREKMLDDITSIA